MNYLRRLPAVWRYTSIIMDKASSEPVLPLLATAQCENMKLGLLYVICRWSHRKYSRGPELQNRQGQATTGGGAGRLARRSCSSLGEGANSNFCDFQTKISYALKKLENLVQAEGLTTDPILLKNCNRRKKFTIYFAGSLQTAKRPIFRDAAIIACDEKLKVVAVGQGSNDR
ncbi:unnamed protein product [Nesidiocoris tenuis]|uniref:Uncharacterized protein n=1 Tax=Nesidiocoris tenuis TaxID=355587 RepID=A0A6H5HPQ1_9HEMI|nr:unnamed protein product [Nesidiocoris tenuis]